LQSGNLEHGACGFPYYVFEEAVLSFLREVRVKDLLPEPGEVDEVFAWAQERTHIQTRIKELKELLRGKDVKTEVIFDALAGLGVREKELSAQLAEAQARAASPLEESWKDCRSLVEAVRDSECRNRLKAVLRRIVDGIWLFVVPQVRVRHAWVQISLASGRGGPVKRLYYIRYCPPPTNGRGGVDGYWIAGSGFLGVEEEKGFDLSTGGCQLVLLEVTKSWVDPRGSARFEEAVREGRVLYRVVPAKPTTVG
jgi:hypothetical protein